MLSQINPIPHIDTYCPISVLTLSFLLLLDLPISLFSVGFPLNILKGLLDLNLTTYSIHPNLLNLINPDYIR